MSHALGERPLVRGSLAFVRPLAGRPILRLMLPAGSNCHIVSNATSSDDSTTVESLGTVAASLLECRSDQAQRRRRAPPLPKQGGAVILSVAATSGTGGLHQQGGPQLQQRGPLVHLSPGRDTGTPQDRQCGSPAYPVTAPSFPRQTATVGDFGPGRSSNHASPQPHTMPSYFGSAAARRRSSRSVIVIRPAWTTHSGLPKGKRLPSSRPRLSD